MSISKVAKLTWIAVLGAWMSLPSLALGTEEDDREEQSEQLDYGSWCSAVTADGVWGHWHGLQSTSGSCAIVQNAIRNHTWSPIRVMRSGYYRLYAANAATVQCDAVYQTFWGYGAQPLSDAFRYAQLYGGYGCLIQVDQRP